MSSKPSLRWVRLATFACLLPALAACGSEVGDPNPGSIESCASQVRTADPSVEADEAAQLCRSYVAKGGVLGERSAQGFNPFAWLGWLGIGTPKVTKSFSYPTTTETATCTVTLRDKNNNGCYDAPEAMSAVVDCPTQACSWFKDGKPDMDKVPETVEVCTDKFTELYRCAKK